MPPPPAGAEQREPWGVSLGQVGHDRRLRLRHGRRRHLQPQAHLERQRLLPGRARCRPLAQRLRLRHDLLQRRALRRLRRQDRLRLRPELALDRARQRPAGQPARLARARQAHAPHDGPPEGHDHARVPRRALRLARAQDRGRRRDLPLPGAVLGLGLHGPRVSLRGGLRHQLHRRSVDDGDPHRHLPCAGRLPCRGAERPHPGPRDDRRGHSDGRLHREGAGGGRPRQRVRRAQGRQSRGGRGVAALESVALQLGRR